MIISINKQDQVMNISDVLDRGESVEDIWNLAALKPIVQCVRSGQVIVFNMHIQSKLL